MVSLIRYPSQSLRTKCKDGPEPSKSLIKKLENIIKRQGAAGIAANQIGVQERVIVVNDMGNLRTFYNPHITELSEATTKGFEMCLSLPGIKAKIERSMEITMTAQEPGQDSREYRFIGYMARVFQHEVDHLDGILMLDRMSKIKKKLLIDKIKRLVRNAKRNT